MENKKHLKTGLLRHFVLRNDNRAQSGNAVLLILIGVALFAALAYTFMKGSKEGQGNLTAQQAKIVAGQIMADAQNIQKAVDTLRTKGCSENELDFTSTSFPSIYTNPATPVDSRCKIFAPEGANLTFPARLEEKFRQQSGWANNGSVNSWEDNYSGFPYFSVAQDLSNPPNSRSDLVLLYPFIKKEICEAVAAATGTTTITSTAIGYPSANADGSYNHFFVSHPVTNEFGCTYKNDDNFYAVYKVLISR